MRMLEYGDVGGGLRHKLPPLHAGPNEPEERIQCVFWIEYARSSSSSGGKRLLHKREEGTAINCCTFGTVSYAYGVQK
jgi:hypothetical protein